VKIGFYGDSFCCEVSNPHSVLKGYDTYIKKIKKHYRADIVHLGVGGSSVWDVILNQFDLNNVPDVCIFCWTDYNRLYNTKLRNLTLGSVTNKPLKDYSVNDLLNRKVISAAKEYFTHLHDFEKARIENIAAMQYFDLNVLSKVNSKIIHLWSFEKQYTWQHGITIDTPLVNFVLEDTWAANHLNGDEQNEKVFQLIKDVL
jgi:hypothetical protein